MFPLYPKSWQRAAFVSTIGANLAVGLCAWPYTVDDAYIVARYANRLARGDGYTFNPGPATDGVTGPLWLLPGWLASLIELDPVLAAKVVGLVAALLAVGLVVVRLAKRSGGTSIALCAAALLAIQPTIGAWGSAGLETGAATALLCLAALAATRRPRPAIVPLGLCAGALAWLRPELAPAVAVLLIAASVRARRQPRIGPSFWIAIGLAAAGWLGVLVFRLVLFDSALPLAYHAKQGSLADGLDYATRGGLIVWGLFGLPLAVAGARRGRSDDRWIAAVLVVHGGSVVLAGGDWMPGFRLFAPVAPLGFWLVAVGAVTAIRRRRGAWRGVAAALLALCMLALGTDLVTRLPEWRNAGEARERGGARLAERLRTHARRVALVDIGYLAYASGVHVIDLGGITDPEIARLPGGHLDKHIRDEWLAARAPDAILLHSAGPPLMAADGTLLGLAGYPVERRIARGAWVQKNFRVALTIPYTPQYHYVLLERRDASHAGRSAVRPLGTRRGD